MRIRVTKVDNQISSFLTDLGLSEYLEKFISEVQKPPEDLAGLTDAELQDDFGITKKKIHRKLLAAIAVLPGGSEKSTPGRRNSISVPDWLATLPTPVAAPLAAEYFEESHPVAKLWSTCDAVEMLVRLLVIGRVAAASDEEARRKAAEQSRRGDRRTDPRSVVRDGAGSRHGPRETGQIRARPDPYCRLWPDRWDLSTAPTSPGTAETSFLRLRNRLAHGGGLTRSEADRLLGLWREPSNARWNRP